MTFEKLSPIRSKKLTQASRGRSCVCCEQNSETVVRCHYSGIRQHSFGKGRGIKGHDLVAADLCISCHSKLDNYETAQGDTKYQRQIDQSEQFLYYCFLTSIRDFKDGVLVTN